MKKVLIGIGIVVVLLLIAFPLLRKYTKSHSPEDQALYEGSNMRVTVDYCQPSKKGRLIFGTEKAEALVPYGKPWRTGANEATEIEFDQDVIFGGKPVDSGRYRLYTIPGEENWEVVLNSELGEWGINFDGTITAEAENNVLSIEVPSVNSMNETEMFTIQFEEIMDNNAVMVMKWDKTTVNVPISMK
mgnify:CR=1 FL=1